LGIRLAKGEQVKLYFFALILAGVLLSLFGAPIVRQAALQRAQRRGVAVSVGFGRRRLVLAAMVV
jgi:hypothetical protein